MHCPRCQHENRPQAKFCEECASPFTGASPTARPYADLKSEVESLRQALTEAVEQQTATAELVQTRNRELAEAQEQQTATSEILRVIASSPTDVQPVFDTHRRQRGSALRGGLQRGWRASTVASSLVALRCRPRSAWPTLEAVPPAPGRHVGTRGRRRRTVHIADVQADPAYDPRDPGPVLHASAAYRTVLGVPMLRRRRGHRRHRHAGGARCGPSPPAQIDLVKTFADQAVIAIENVRLFNETQETLEQQTATSEILRVIASSPTDVQPVFDTIVRSAARLCDGVFGGLYRFDGELIHLAAAHNLPPEALAAARQIFPAPLTRELTVGRAILDRTVAHIPDVELDPEYKRSWAPHGRSPKRC